jgi:hypothetical protein
MIECNICYDDKIKSEICKRTCCSYSICHECSDRLLENKCPFCRKEFRTRRHSISALSPMPSVSWNQSMDDMYVDSRWFRRQMRRQERNRQLEVNNEMNRNLSRSFQNRKTKSRLKSELRRQVKEYIYQRDYYTY